jgi:hypothetical protein
MDVTTIDGTLDPWQIERAVARFRDRAAHCRAMAAAASSNGIAEELVAIAKDYEDDAATLELKAGTRAS